MMSDTIYAIYIHYIASMSITLNLKYQDGTTEQLKTNTNQTLHVLYVHVATLPPGISDRLVYHKNILLPDDNTKIGTAGIVNGDTLVIHEFSSAQKAEYDNFVNTTPEPLAFIASKSSANRSRGLFIEAIKQKPEAFVYVSAADQTDEINTLAVKGNGDLVKRIISPSEQVTIEAVKQKPSSLRHIANPTEATVIEAVSIDGTALSNIPHNQQTSAMVIAAVTQNGMALVSANPALQTTPIVTTAVTNDGMAIQYADEAYVDITVMTIAVTQNPYAILVGPNTYKTNDDIIAIALNGAPKIATLLP